MKKKLFTLGLASIFSLGANAMTNIGDTVLEETCTEKVHVYVDGVYVGSFEIEVPGSDCGTTCVWFRIPNEDEQPK